MRGKLRNMLKERGVHYEPKEEDEDFDEEEGYETVEWRVCWHGSVDWVGVKEFVALMWKAVSLM